MSTLILTVGLPRSGKTTWARSSGLPIVNPDSVRFAMHGRRFWYDAEPLVWAHVDLMVRSLFLAGCETLVLDATNVSMPRREKWRSRAYDTVFKLFLATKEECLARCRPDDSALREVIERMALGYQAPGIGDESGWLKEYTGA